jgi:hypothetical protein
VIALHARDQLVVPGNDGIDPAAVVERVEVHLQRPGPGVGAEELIAANLEPAPHGLGVEVLGVVEHDVRLQRVVCLVGAAGRVLAEVLLEVRRE